MWWAGWIRRRLLVVDSKVNQERVCMWEISRIIDDPLVILKRKTPLGCAALRCEGSSG